MLLITGNIMKRQAVSLGIERCRKRSDGIQPLLGESATTGRLGLALESLQEDELLAVLIIAEINEPVA